MSFTQQGEGVSLSSSGEVFRYTVPVPGGVLHMVGVRNTDGSQKAVSAAFQAVDGAASPVLTVVTDAENVDFSTEELLNGIILRSGPADTFSDSTPDAADLIAEWSGGTVGSTALVTFVNTTAFTMELALGSGVLSSGPMQIGARSSARMAISITDTDEVTLYALEAAPILGLAATKVTSLDQTAGVLPQGVSTGARLVVMISSNATPGDQELRTAAQMTDDSNGAQAGDSYILRIANTGAGTLTLTDAGDASATVVGDATIAQNEWQEYAVVFSADLSGDPLVTATYIGSGTYSP